MNKIQSNVAYIHTQIFARGDFLISIFTAYYLMSFCIYLYYYLLNVSHSNNALRYILSL